MAEAGELERADDRGPELWPEAFVILEAMTNAAEDAYWVEHDLVPGRSRRVLTQPPRQLSAAPEAV